MRYVPISILLACALWTQHASADDAFYRVERSELTVTEGAWPADGADLSQHFDVRRATRSYAVLDGEGEIYAVTRTIAHQRRLRLGAADLVLHVRAPAGVPVRGRVFVPTKDAKAMTSVSFLIPPDAAKPDARDAFHEAKLIHYEDLLNRQIAGAAWFRHQAREAAAALGDKGRQLREQMPRRGIDDTFSLFTGGAAVAENLQLDRGLLLRPAAGEKTHDVDSIRGITVREFDWTPLVKDAKPERDPLASLIPSDQHALFIPSFESALRLLDEANVISGALLDLAESRSEDPMILERYQRQLCVPLTPALRMMAPKLINGLAITGSDLYFKSGTDVALLFEAKDATALSTMLSAQFAAARNANPAAKAVSGTAGGLPYTGVVSPDRSTCAYMATLDNTVIVANSLHQLEQIAATRDGSRASLASLAEYTFFRDRYRRSDADEAMLAILPDAAIRRWCGARWRIADSRRTRAAAAMAELQASQLHAIATRRVEPKLLSQDLIAGEDIHLTPGGVLSSTYGTLSFMTPIAELHVDQVTSTEADAYERWRDGYEQNWRNYFDPIAIRIGTSREKLTTDLTVMPLIEATEYKQVIELTSGAKFAADAGDPHDALAQFIVSVKPGSDALRSLVSHEEWWAKSDQWLGNSISVYLDPDPWKFPPERGGLSRIPIALRAESRDPEKLAASLELLRAAVERRSQGALGWETRRHNGIEYAHAVLTGHGPEQRAPWYDQIAYVALPDSLTVSLSEAVIKRAIDRHVARANAKAPPTTRPWLASNVGVRIEREFIKLLAGYGIGRWDVQFRSWSNIPILNEWRRLYPDQDPVELHAKLWGVRPVCPAGGKYVWNDRYQTMESTVLGHPGEPKKGPNLSPLIEMFRAADFGIDFEHAGLRARASLWKDAPPHP